MRKFVTESDAEDFSLQVLQGLGYEIFNGENIGPESQTPLRNTFQDVVIISKLREAINKLNPQIPQEARERALKTVLRTDSPNLTENNKAFHKLLTEGVSVQYKQEDRNVWGTVNLIDFKNPQKNDFTAINQYTVVEDNNNRRPDIILFINGLPLVIFELKNPADEQATIETAYKQFQTYKEQLPSLFRFNEILIISDWLEARAGTITSGFDRFMPWKTIDGKKKSTKEDQLETLIKGMLNKTILLDLIRHFIVFEQEKQTQKKLAAYHQYHAVNKAIQSTIKATQTNKKAGIVWHTQGSGKSLIMVFYTGKIVLELDNPTIVVLTDRNDLDDQLFGTFGRCKELLRQAPVQADSREKLKELLKVSSGGIVFTTIQKFFPEENREKYPLLSERKNIIVIADEAHRTQYGFGAKILKDKGLITYGYAKYVRDGIPNASFIAFTGTPIEKVDRNTPAVFGKYVDVYDIQQAVDDGATVRIYYESRLAKLELKPEERPKIDEEFEEVTEGEETTQRELLKSKWARLEKVVGSKERIRRVAKDFLDHFENRNKILEGKAIIVCMSRRICVSLYNEIIKLRPKWHNSEDDKGAIKVIMTGSASDNKDWQEHIRNKERRRELGDRFKDKDDPFKIALVRDMWLTGFDAPCLHTMYVDKPMKGHGLMQAIARVNRVHKDKQAGLIVDYIGIAPELKKALADYTESGGEGKPVFDQEQAVGVMKEKYEIVKDMFHGFDYKKFFKLDPQERMKLMNNAMDHVLGQKDGKERYLQNTTSLLRAFSITVPHPEAMKIKEEVGFFQAVKAIIAKNTVVSGRFQEDIDTAINQILSKAIVSDRVVDIFEAAGLKKPDLALLSEKFLLEVKEMPQKNLALEMLKKLLNDQIKIRMKKNIVQGRSFMEMLEETIRRYTNRSIEAAEVVEQLIEIAKKIRESDKRPKELNLNEAEIAFYDALGTNDSAVKVLGDEILRKIAIELTETIRNNVTIDWTMRESVQAKLRVMVKRILRKYDYPPDKQAKATELVLDQAKEIAKDWASA